MPPGIPFASEQDYTLMASTLSPLAVILSTLSYNVLGALVVKYKQSEGRLGTRTQISTYHH